jgi:hypothetical protein
LLLATTEGGGDSPGSVREVIRTKSNRRACSRHSVPVFEYQRLFRAHRNALADNRFVFGCDSVFFQG